MRLILLVALAVLALDFGTKRLVIELMPRVGHSVEAAGDLIRWTHVQNQGSAFGLFQGGRLFFIAFSAISILLILALARSPRYRARWYAASLGMILGGALGNLVDRVATGAVTDFIDVGIGPHRWPTFNVADIGVTVGVALLALRLLRGDPREGTAPEVSDRPGDGAAVHPDV